VLEHSLLEKPLATAGTKDGLAVGLGDGGVLDDGLLRPVLPVVQVVTHGAWSSLVIRRQAHGCGLAEQGLRFWSDEASQDLGEGLGNLGQVAALKAVTVGP
jgi:hypothetical protein